jgi:hypothetical protein
VTPPTVWATKLDSTQVVIALDAELDPKPPRLPARK